MEVESKVCQDEVQGLLCRAENLLVQAKNFQTKEAGIFGIGKLIKKIQAECTFIKSLKNRNVVNENHLSSTNLIHLEGLLHSAKSFDHVTHVLQTVHFKDDQGNDTTVIVDVVANGGLSWVKVTARKARALHRIWIGDGEYGEHDIVEQAMQYLQASGQHPVNYRSPTVHVVFYGGITQAIVDCLAKLSIKAKGFVYKTFEESWKPYKLPLPEITNVDTVTCPNSLDNCSKVNLDVTTLVALVSDLTHGGCAYTFKEPLIEELAKQERRRPLVPEIEKFLQGKELYVCQTAFTDFKNILSTIGGPKERKRAEELFSRIEVVDDCLSDRADSMGKSNRIKRRAKIIFGTGDKNGAITTTANNGFVRAAKNQGVSFAVYIHESRALTEKKQNPEPDLASEEISEPSDASLTPSDSSSSDDDKTEDSDSPGLGYKTECITSGYNGVPVIGELSITCH